MFRNGWQYLLAVTDNAKNPILERLQKSQSKRAKVLQNFITNISYWDQPSGKA